MSKKHFRLIQGTGAEKGQVKTLEGAFKEHATALRAFLRGRLIIEEDREDVMQEVFLKLTRQQGLAEKLSTTTGSTLSYLIAIATNLIIDRKRREAVRKAGQHESLKEDELLSDQPTPESAAANSQQLDAMVVVMRKMKPKWSEALMLNRFEHMSYPEVAQAMGVSTTSVERYIAYALKLLREEVK